MLSILNGHLTSYIVTNLALASSFPIQNSLSLLYLWFRFLVLAYLFSDFPKFISQSFDLGSLNSLFLEEVPLKNPYMYMYN